MATYFDTISRSFADVPVTDDGVDTVAFLEASEGLAKMFDLLGSGAFSVVQNDLNGNITKVRTRYLVNPESYNTIEKLVIGEKGEKKRTATEGLLWLLRGLQFTCEALKRSYANKSEELAESFTKAYEGTLKKFHSFVVRPVFALAMKACPYRSDFYQKLGPADKVDTDMQTWLTALDGIVKHLQAFYEDGGHGKGF
ncbi:hypothetical protein FRC03_001603 [Tulasnella sp. 419]|nr:hypothetical protein FRC02_005231 [Tulasnella sp. 418]KAG8964573.1 hypothetical protein FRC03_001603 [Tulasnella sp. 419]